MSPTISLHILILMDHHTETMAATWSDAESTIASPSKTSVKREVQGMYGVVKKERGEKNKAIIAVVRPESLVELERECQKSWWKFWRGELPNDKFASTSFEYPTHRLLKASLSSWSQQLTGSKPLSATSKATNCAEN
jgi:hypothetical protein